MAEKLSSKIYNSIKADIDSGVIDGRSFLSEAQLAKQFGVSKAPVRDALHLLCSQGYLISYPRKGYMLNLYSSDEINQIQVIRRQVEKLCVKLAIENASNEEILSLKEFTEQQMGSSDPSKTNNTMFHLRLAEITGNQYLPGILQDMLYKASMAAIKSSSDLEKHQHIVNALLERDLEKAELYLEEDIMML
ncbi:GntR family transcriptional regulator [Senimuribacter intestinalis]|uniref:GntR family transcriptional regulator n=1 Tax=Senimuribacter intestinalis TaxID=2941507 RepID=UPI00203DF217|nr:GntR family transcriptional regulator [Senimuribacter intestinalis]